MEFPKENKKRKRIADLIPSSRPREKFLAKGPENLTDAELLAILLRTGSRKNHAVSLAETILRQFPLGKLTKEDLSALRKIPGIGTVKAIEILAAVELGKRMFSSPSLTKIVIQSTPDALAQFKDIAGKKQEYLIAIYLNARNEVIRRETLGIGSVNANIIEPKEIFSHALSVPCVSLILAHNHPSGDASPSDADIQFTKRIHEAGELMGIIMLDHLIVSANGYFSFREGK